MPRFASHDWASAGALMRGGLVAGLLLGVALAPATTHEAAAAPLQQNFECGEAGTPTPAGRFSCWNWTTPSGHAPPGGDVTWVHDCGPGDIVIGYWYHWEGAPFQVTQHVVGPEEHQLTVSATNAGRGDGAFWVTGRCRSV